MSSDNQPRKRKDNKKKRKDDEPQNEDINIHVHKDGGTGGGICAKIVFIFTSCALVILIGLIIKENGEITELENIETESRFAQAFEGWIEEHVDNHSPESLDHEDKDHDHDDDNDDHGDNDKDEEEEEATEETEGTEEDEHDSENEEVSTEQDEDEGETVEEDIDEDSQTQSAEETIEDENTEETEEEDKEVNVDEESHEDTKESLNIRKTPVERLSKYKSKFSKKPSKDDGDDDHKDKATIIQERLSKYKYKAEKSKISRRSIKDDEDKKDESTEDKNKNDEDAKKTKDIIKDEKDENELEKTSKQDEENVVKAAEKSQIPDEILLEVVDDEVNEGTKDSSDGDKEQPQSEDTENESRASTKIGVGLALVYVAYKVFLRRQTDPELERPPRRESELQSETPTSLSRRNTIIPPPTLEEVEADLNQVEDTGEYSEDEYSEEESIGEHHMSPKEEYQELRTKYSRSLTPEGDFVSKKSRQVETKEPRDVEEEEEEEEYLEEELSEEQSDSPEEDIESSEEGEEDEDDDEALLKRLEAKYGKIGRDVKVPSEGAESDSDRQSEDEYVFSNITNKEDEKIRTKIDKATEEITKNAAYANKLFDALLENYPHSPRVLYGKALTLDALADQRRSNDLLNMAVSFYSKVMINEHVPDALFIKAAERYIDRQTFLGNYRKTIPAFKKLIGKFPDDRSYVHKLVVTYMTINEIEEARTNLKEMLLTNPNYAFALVHYGFILKTTDNNLEEAIKYLEKGLKSEEPIVQDGRFYYHLGDALIRLGRKEDAMRVFENGVKNKALLSKYQRSLYNVPNLTAKPWWSPEDLPNIWKLIQKLKSNWQSIRKEALAVLNERGYFIDEKENLKETGEWKQLDLFVRGQKIVKNCAKTPVTCNIIQMFPEASKCRRGQTKFSIMHPNTHVWAHCGPTNTRLRIHLGLIVPEGTSIRVAEDTRTWKEGDVIIFDDSFEHEVWHNGTSLRLVLMVDVWHPDLSESLKKSLSAI